MSRVLFAKFPSASLVLTPCLVTLVATLWPVVAGGQLPYSYDFVLEFYPIAAFSHRAWTSGQIPFWNPYEASGTPFLGDPTAAVLYPPNALLFALLDAASALRVYIVFHVIVAYVAAYYFLRQIGVGRLGAVYGALSYSFGGYVLSRIVWPNYLAAFAILPLAFSFAERAGVSRTPGAAVRSSSAAGLFLGCFLMAGTPQLAFYVVPALGAYLVWRSTLLKAVLCRGVPTEKVISSSLSVLLPLVIGFAAASVQLLPQIEFVLLSNRSAAYQGQAMGGLNPSDLWLLLFGGAPGETISTYLGAGSVLFAVFACLYRPSGHVRYFAVVSLVTLPLALTRPPLPWALLQYVPGFSLFGSHMPERVLGLTAFSVCVLSGVGIDRVFSKQPCGLNTAGPFAVCTSAVGLVFAFPLAVGILPLPDEARMLVFLVATIALVHASFVASRGKILVQTALVGLLVADLTLHFRAMPFQYSDLARHFASSPTAPLVSRYSVYDLARIVGVDPSQPWNGYDSLPSSVGLVTGNSGWVYGLYDPQGYNPLHINQYWSFLQALNAGLPIDYHLLLTANPASNLLKLLNVRYIVAPSDTTTLTSVLAAGITLTETNREWAGPSGNPWPIDNLVIISSLANSVPVPQGRAIGRVVLQSTDGRILSWPIRAGIDTAEWAYDRPDVRAVVRHTRAKIYKSDVTNSGFAAHTYMTTFAISRPVVIQTLRLELQSTPEAPDLVWSIVAVQAPQPIDSYARQINDRGGYRIWEMKSYIPRAFLAGAIKLLGSDGEVLERMRDPSFDPLQEALVVEPAPGQQLGPTTGQLPESQVRDRRIVKIVSYEPNRVQVDTRSTAPGMLVLADTYYPAWRATIDGRPTRVYRVDQVFRGVAVPSGVHSVVFYYQDPWFVAGACISSLALTVVAATVIVPIAVRKWRERDTPRSVYPNI